MIPEEIVRFLEGATVGFVATRDDKLVPYLHFVTGWIAGDDGETLTCLFPGDHAKTLIPCLEDNGQLTFVVLGSTSGPKASKPPNPAVDAHECYQFKGDHVGTRPASDGDISVVDRIGERFRKLWVPLFGFSEESCTVRFRKPSLAVTFKVREIYDQTPGPGAGRRIVSEEG